MTTATATKPKHKRESTKTKTLSASRAAKAAKDHETPDPTTDSLQLFFNEARKYPLLTAAEEIQLAKRIERLQGRRQYRDSMRSIRWARLSSA